MRLSRSLEERQLLIQNDASESLEASLLKSRRHNRTDQLVDKNKMKGNEMALWTIPLECFSVLGKIHLKTTDCKIRAAALSSFIQRDPKYWEIK